MTDYWRCVQQPVHGMMLCRQRDLEGCCRGLNERGTPAYHLRDGQHERAQALQVDLERAAGNVDDIAAQEDALDALAVLAVAHAAEGVILAAQVHAHCVLQLVLGAAHILGPAAEDEIVNEGSALQSCRLAPASHADQASALDDPAFCRRCDALISRTHGPGPIVDCAAADAGGTAVI